MGLTVNLRGTPFRPNSGVSQSLSDFRLVGTCLRMEGGHSYALGAPAFRMIAKWRMPTR